MATARSASVRRSKLGITVETRRYCVPITALGALPQLCQWRGLQSLGIVVRERRLWNQITTEVHFYLQSAPDAQLPANAVRSHWQIENAALDS